MNHPAYDKQVRATLANPSISLLAYGHVQDQSTGNAIRYNPNAITDRLQSTIVSYFSNPPLTADGQVRWLVLLGYRQAGKSTAPELCAYAKTAYTPGWDHVCIADTRNRAEYLHGPKPSARQPMEAVKSASLRLTQQLEEKCASSLVSLGLLVLVNRPILSMGRRYLSGVTRKGSSR